MFTLTLKKIASNFDFSSRFDKTLFNILKQTIKTKKHEISTIKLPDAEKLIGEEIPFDTLVYISLDDVCKLKIDPRNKTSDHPQYAKNCRFEFHMINSNLYSIRRTRS